MATPVIMPKAGMAMEEGTVVQWLKKEGDSIVKGEVILEIETDKVTMEVEAETSGILLKILSDEGEVVPVIQTIGWIGDKGEQVPDSNEPASTAIPGGQDRPDEPTPAVSGDSQPSDGVPDGKIPATPAAKRLAEELDVNLSEVGPSGKHGEILSRDIRASVIQAAPREKTSRRISPLAAKQAELRGIELQGIQGSGPRGRIMTRDIPDITRAPLTGIRRAASRAMSASHAEIVPVTLNAESDVTLLMKALSQDKARRDNAPGLNDVLIKAAASALRECPWMYSHLEGDEIVTPGEIHIGIAVALSEGLIVPVIRNPDRLVLPDLHAKAADLIERARNRTLRPDELSGAVFTLTNLGMFGITHFTPVVPLPQSAILGVGAVDSRLKMNHGTPKEVLILPMSLTIDHRLIDGAQGALFLSALRTYLEDPSSLVI